MLYSNCSVLIRMSKFRRELNQWLRFVQNNPESKIVVTRNNKHVGVLIPPSTYSKIKKVVLKQRGAEEFTKQLRDAGGTCSIDEVSQLLGISQKEVKEKTGSELLGIQFKGKVVYPVWQFNGSVIIEYFSEIMAMLKTDSSVGIVQFFLTTDEDLHKKPIDVLKDGDKKEIATVKILAKQFYRQVAR
jgi:PHD/YefM family antitoxin component YafN of YafNO toxin-antitoxin module